jgi:glycosyltransferase involved in cell wall biosynthesis
LCVPTYGRAHHLGETLRSALAQTISDIEIVVVDDCSPDNTAEVVNGIRDSRVRFIRNEINAGVPENYNRVMNLARGSYLLLLEDHDLLEPTYLERTLDVMHRNSRVGFVATGMVTIDDDDKPHEEYVENFAEVTRGRQLLRRLLTRHDSPFSITALIRRSAASHVRPLFDPKYWWYADLNLWMQIAAVADFGYVREKLLRFRLREDGHFLLSREWESLFCIEQLHRDNWHLLFTRPGAASAVGWMSFERAKLREIIYMKMRRKAMQQAWTAADDSALRRYLQPPLRLLTDATALVPASFLRLARRVHRARFKYQAT